MRQGGPPGCWKNAVLEQLSDLCPLHSQTDRTAKNGGLSLNKAGKRGEGQAFWRERETAAHRASAWKAGSIEAGIPVVFSAAARGCRAIGEKLKREAIRDKANARKTCQNKLAR